MDVQTVACDVCGQVKEQTNGWLVAVICPYFEGVIFQPSECCVAPRNASLLYEDICGQACAHKRLSRYLDDLKASQAPTQESVTA